MSLIKKALENIKDCFTDKKGFYMLILTEKSKQNTLYQPPLYIGLAFKQELEIRSGQSSGHQTAYECVIKRSIEKSLFIKLGVLRETSLEKETEQLYEDIEKCLISCNQPLCNTFHKDKYASRRDMQITNYGEYKPLNDVCKCTSNQICKLDEDMK